MHHFLVTRTNTTFILQHSSLCLCRLCLSCLEIQGKSRTIVNVVTAMNNLSRSRQQAYTICIIFTALLCSANIPIELEVQKQLVNHKMRGKKSAIIWISLKLCHPSIIGITSSPCSLPGKALFWISLFCPSMHLFFTTVNLQINAHKLHYYSDFTDWCCCLFSFSYLLWSIKTALKI